MYHNFVDYTLSFQKALVKSIIYVPLKVVKSIIKVPLKL